MIEVKRIVTPGCVSSSVVSRVSDLRRGGNVHRDTLITVETEGRI